MLLQLNFRIHPRKAEAGSIKLTRHNVVEMSVVVTHQTIFALFIPVHPFQELISQIVHLLRDKKRRILKHHAFVVSDANLPMIKRSLENGQGVCIFRPKGRIHLDFIRPMSIHLALYLPLSCGGCILDESICSAIFQHVLDKLFNILRRDPCCSQVDFDLIGSQILRFHLLQSCKIFIRAMNLTVQIGNERIAASVFHRINFLVIRLQVLLQGRFQSFRLQHLWMRPALIIRKRLEEKAHRLGVNCSICDLPRVNPQCRDSIREDAVCFVDLKIEHDIVAQTLQIKQRIVQGSSHFGRRLLQKVEIPYLQLIRRMIHGIIKCPSVFFQKQIFLLFIRK